MVWALSQTMNPEAGGDYSNSPTSNRWRPIRRLPLYEIVCRFRVERCSDGNIVWKSAQEVGAWSVQFQPDVTSPTCTGIWCGGFNGFLK